MYRPSTGGYGGFKVCTTVVSTASTPALQFVRGAHHPSPGIRSRVFYLLYKFLREERGDIPIELIDTLLDRLQDLLIIQVELPEIDDQQDIFSEAVNNPGIFDSQLFLFEAAGM